MAQFSSYLAPSITTDVIYEQGGVSLFGDARIPVLLGEGQETRTLEGIEMHRGSSAVADDLRVGENLSSQVDGETRTFYLTYGPVVRGDGTGTIATDPTAVQLYTLDTELNKLPLRVVTLNGLTRKIEAQDVLPKGSPLYATYYFKRTDTKILNEDLSDQIPAFASLTVQGVTFGLSQPGFSGNTVTLAFTVASSGNGVTDTQAVSGIGSDVISIELRRQDNVLRNSYDVMALVQAGIGTKSGGQLTFVGPRIGNPIILAAAATTHFTGGSGQNTNLTFKLKNAPVVDGTNGGRITNLPSKIAVIVDGKTVPATVLDGNTGLFSLSKNVLYGSTLKVTYFTNNYQDTFDILPSALAVEALNVGFAPGRNDFYSGTDFLLGDEGKIYWGNAAIVKAGHATPGYVPFDATAVTTSLVDEKMFLRQCVGQVDGINTVFTLPDVPVDGSGVGAVTDNPLLISVFIGPDPVTAYEDGAVRVVRLYGGKGQFTLFNPPPASTLGSPVNIYATYWRNTMGNHEFTLDVNYPGTAGQGTYQIKDQGGFTAPAFTVGALSITEANAAVTGLVWPNSKMDLRGVAGRTPDEIITLTFQNDGTTVQVPATQATNTAAAPGIMFQATTPGIGPNSADANVPGVGKPALQLVSQAACSDGAAITVAGEIITININRDTTDANAQTRTLGEIIDLVNAGAFTDTSNLLGGLTATLLTGWDAATKAQAGHSTGFVGGAAAVTNAASCHYKVTSSRDNTDVALDGLGITGGATTDAGQPTLGADGYLNQTFSDLTTGVTWTLVDPSLAFDGNDSAATDYGFTVCPSPAYQFKPGDTIAFNVTAAGVHLTGATPNIALYGVKLLVPSTYGMNAGDTLTVTTHNRAGSEPNVGDYYYLDLVVEKSDAELASLTYYTSEGKLYHDMGEALPENKASLGGHFMFLNGANLIAVRQVKKDVGMTLASDETYIDAISDLKKNLPGQSHKANVIVPMTTSESVIQYLSRHLITQASPRNKGEAMGFVGMPTYAVETEAQNLATALGSERLVLVYPGAAIVSLTQNGVATDYTVGGEFLAAALAGLFLNPSNDVATDLTLQVLAGFKGLARQIEEPLMDLMAQSGVTVLLSIPGGIQIRQYVSTSTDSVLKIEPYVTSIMDETRQRTRAALKEFIAKKNVQARMTDIGLQLNGLMSQLVSDQILTAFKPAKVTASPTDPRVVNVSIDVQPMMSILWINVTFSVSSKL